MQERSGFTGRVTVYHNLLVFRRPVDGAPQEQLLTVPNKAEPDTNILKTEFKEIEAP
jgi:hypothetical protein